MKVEFAVTFTEQEIFDLCLGKCRTMPTVVPGKFQVKPYSYAREVTCEFIAESEEKLITLFPEPCLAEAAELIEAVEPAPVMAAIMTEEDTPF